MMGQVIDLAPVDPFWSGVTPERFAGPLGDLVFCWMSMALTQQEARDALACKQTFLDLVGAAGGLPPEDMSPPYAGEREELLGRLIWLRGPLRDLVQTNTVMVRDDLAPARHYFALLEAAGWIPRRGGAGR